MSRDELVAPAVLAALDRHGRRRERGYPTISLLVGPPDRGARLWADWLARNGRRGGQCSDCDSGAVIAAWFCASRAREREEHGITRLESWVLGWAAGVLEAPGGALAGGGVAEREAIIAALEAQNLAHEERIACRWALLDAPGAGEQNAVAALLQAIEQQALVGPQPGWARGMAALAGMMPDREVPGLLLSALDATWPSSGDANRGQFAGSWLAGAAGVAGNLARATTAIPVAVVVASRDYQRYLDASTPESNLRAMLREGLIELADDDAHRADAHRANAHRADAGAQIRPPHGMGGVAAGALQYLESRGVSKPVIAAFTTAAEARQRAHDAAEGDKLAADSRARSAAEQALFAALEEISATRGLFVLNQRIDIQFGSALMEIDLLADSLALAVEIDGYYHFRDTDAYRRDRRKDLLLQTHGYLVLRFLADDVIENLPGVLSTIQEMVVVQRART